jgi:signal transduction histidine kinase
MATLAQLATGVAHEIRNPLTSIKMLIQVNRDKFATNGLPTGDMDLVEQEIRRMERSVNSLLEYARPEQGELVEFELQTTIEKTARLISGQCSAQNVRLDLSLPPAPLRIFGDPSQIQQLLLNLSLNGLDAMPSSGTLTMTAEANESNAIITVSDTGHGIRDDVLDKLFAPFVTTKPNGVGLGLGICRRIAEGHAGQLTGSNVDSGGAQFYCVLPLVAQSAPKFVEANG